MTVDPDEGIHSIRSSVPRGDRRPKTPCDFGFITEDVSKCFLELKNNKLMMI